MLMRPKVLSDVEVMFPASISDLMPPMKSIPEEFLRRSTNKWSQLFNDWFYRGIRNLKLTPKENIEINVALRHIKAIMGSFEPKHEHKEAAVAFLMSEWFEDVEYEVVPKPTAPQRP
jgi:hypothetical protein